jgi:hypothetical protein
LSLALCRFTTQGTQQQLASGTADRTGGFELNIPLDQQGLISCHPPTMPHLELSAFVSTVGQLAGGHLSNEEVTPASAVIVDVILANSPVDPQAEKETLSAALSRAEPDITVLVETATLLYRTLFDSGTEPDVGFSGVSSEGDDGADADSGGAAGEAGDGGEFSPLPGALCTFSLDADGLVRTDTLLGDVYADGQVNRRSLQDLATSVNQAIDAERRQAITQAFATLFPIGIGPSIATMADGVNTATPGYYFLPTFADVPGVITCIPETFDHLVLRTCVRDRALNEVLEAEDVTPISSLICELANEAQQSGTTMDREATKLELFGRLEPLRIYLSEDRNGNGVQDGEERDKNGDGRFATLVELASDVPLAETDRDLALLASMSTTIFDTLRTQRDRLESTPLFSDALNDFFDDANFSPSLTPIASDVESALYNPANQVVLGTDDVVTASRTGTLQGRVTDARGRPVNDVRVEVSQNNTKVAVPDNPAITDVDGRFFIRNIPVGDATVRVFLDEFEVLRVTTKVVAVVTVTLEIAPTSELEARPSDLVFNDVEVGSSRVLPVRLANRGLAPLTLRGLVIEGEGAAAFRFQRRPMLPVAIAAESEVTVHVHYEPTEATSSLATLRVESDAHNTPILELPIIGTGVERAVPQIELSRTQFHFGEVQLESFETQIMVVRNSGTAPLTIQATTIEAPPESGFTLERVPTLPAVLPPNGELTFRVRFQPARTGVSRGTLLIHSDADEASTHTAALNGMGVEAPAPELMVEPSVIEFGQVQVNSPGSESQFVTKTVTLHNTGTDTLTLTALRVDSSQSNEFRLFRSPTLPITLIPGASLSLQVRYLPTVIGSVTGAVRVLSNVPNVDHVTIALNGTGVETRVPSLTVSEEALDFGEVAVGTTGRLSVHVINAGNGNLDITSLALQSDQNQAFKVVQQPQPPFTLVPGSSQQLQVQFQPSAEGYVTDVLNVESNDQEQPRRRISLRGVGTSETVPQMTASPAEGSFGEVQVGATSSIVVTISNPGKAALTINALEGSVASSEAFALRRQPRLPVLVRPDAAVDVEVVFRPQRVGSVIGTLQIRGTAPDTPTMTVPLYGTGTSQASPKIQVSPQTLDYGEVLTHTSQTETLTVDNRGNVDLVIDGVSITNQSPPAFEIARAPQVPVTIIPGSSAQVDIRYSPIEPGVASGTLQLTGNDPDQPAVTVSLSGFSTPAASPQIQATPDALSFGEVQIDQTRRLTLEVRNTGSATLQLTNLSIDDPAFHLADSYNLPIRIRSQGVVRLDVLYAPTELSSNTGTLRLEHNSSARPTVIVPLSGDGIPESKPRLEITPAMVDFSNVQVGSRRRLPIQIFNTGTAPLNVTDLRVDAGPSEAFILVENPAPVTVVEGGSIQAYVVFEPLQVGSVTGTFYVESNVDNTGDISLPLRGHGLEAAIPQIDATPAIVEFPEVAIGASRVEKVTIRNTGTDNLEVTSLNVDGGDNDEFRLLRAPTLPVMVLPDGAIEVFLTFTPTAADSTAGTLTIISNDPNNPATVLSLTGIGAPVAKPQVAASMEALPFSEVEVGNTRTRDLIISNVSNTILTIREIKVASEPEGAFSLADVRTPAAVSTDAISVAPQSEVSVGVVFTPKTAGLKTGTLQITSDAANVSPLTVSLEGTGTDVPMPTLVVSPAAIDFGAAEIGLARTLTVSMRNEGTKGVTISELALMAADGVSFELVAAPDLPTVVSPNDTVTAELRFVPTTTGTATGTLHILSDDSDNPDMVLPVSGEALPEPVVQLTVSPSPMDFGEIRVDTAQTLPLSMTNIGSAPLDVTGLTVSNGVNNIFQLGLDRQTPFTVNPGDTETINVVFRPTAAGVFTGTVGIQSNVPAAMVPLRGTGIAPAITLTPATLDFGVVSVGSSRTLTVTAMNTGRAALNISAITIAGVGFTLGADATPGILQPNATKTFEVTYQPNSRGVASGVVRVNNDTAENAVAEIPLGGTGAAPGISVTPNVIDFGGVLVGESGTQTFTIGNPGNAMLELSASISSPTNDVFVLENMPASLAPSAQATVTIRFNPSAAGAVRATVQLTSNAVPNAITMQVTGTGIALSELIVTPPFWDFGEVALGEAPIVDLIIENGNPTPVTITNIDIVAGADAGFALQTAFGNDVVLTPNGSTTATVVYTPSTPGPSEGLMRVESSAGDVEVGLNGVGVAVPASIAVNPAVLTYDSVLLGGTRNLALTINNPSHGALTIADIRVVEGVDLGFALSSPFAGPVKIVPRGGITIRLAFAPREVVDVMGSVEIVSNADEGLVTVPLSGRGEISLPARLAVEPATIDFGNVPLNHSQTQALILRNEGNEPLTINSVALTAGSELSFAMVEDPSEGFDIVPGGTAIIPVSFKPSRVGMAATNIQITSNAVNTPVFNVPLSGTSTAQPSAWIDVGPQQQVDFSYVQLATTRIVPIQITNTGNAALILNRVSIPEGANTGFAMVGNPIVNVVLAPGNTLEVPVTSTPVVENIATGLLRVESNAVNEPVVERPLSVTGTADAVPMLTVTPQHISFGSISVGNRQTIGARIQNTGDTNLTVANVLIAEGSASGFEVTAAPATLAPGETLAATAVFTPVAPGPVTGTFRITSDAFNGAEQLVSLQGTGVAQSPLSTVVAP